MSTSLVENYKASFSPTPGENPLFIRVGPKNLKSAIFKVPKMAKFWPESADIEPAVSSHENVHTIGFSRAPCSERIVSNPLQEISENIQQSSAPSSSGSSCRINENVTVMFSPMNQQQTAGCENSSQANQTLGVENNLIDEIGMFSPSSLDLVENVSQFTSSSIFDNVNIELYSPVPSPAGPLSAL